MPATYEKRGALGGRVPAGSCSRPGSAAVSVETFRPVEIKHAPRVRSFHGMQSFHVVAACGAAAPRGPGPRAGSGPRGRRKVDGGAPRGAFSISRPAQWRPRTAVRAIGRAAIHYVARRDGRCALTGHPYRITARSVSIRPGRLARCYDWCAPGARPRQITARSACAERPGRGDQPVALITASGARAHPGACVCPAGRVRPSGRAATAGRVRASGRAATAGRVRASGRAESSGRTRSLGPA
jgi:hypothetical protein